MRQIMTALCIIRRNLVFHLKKFFLLSKSETQTAEISSAIEERIKTRMNDFEGYAPESVQLLEDAKKSVRGKYVFLPLRREQKNI